MVGLKLLLMDTGIGIPEDELPHVFDEFYRASNARKVERDGTGLGLSIARQIVERHGGEMWAEIRSRRLNWCFYSVVASRASRMGD